MYDPLTIWFYASKGIWVDFPRKWKLALLQIKWLSIMKLSVSIVLLRRPIVDTLQRLQIKVCTTTRSEVVPSSLDFFIKFAFSSLDKWLSHYEPRYDCFNYRQNSPFCHHFRVRSAFLLIRIAIGKTNKFNSGGVKRIWSAYISRAATPYALTGAILLLLAASTLSCWMYPLARIALPQTTWPPRVPPECPCWRRA